MATVQVRYIVNDVDAAIDFYCQQLGFREDMHPAPSFAMLSRGDLRLVLSRPGGGPGGGGQAMADGTLPTPGGWNRFAIELSDLGKQSGLLVEATHVLGVGSPIRAQDLQGDDAAIGQVFGLVDGPHAALPQLLADAVVAEEFRQFGRGDVRRGHVHLLFGRPGCDPFPRP